MICVAAHTSLAQFLYLLRCADFQISLTHALEIGRSLLI